MSEERRAALEAEMDERIQERIDLLDEWADGIYTYDEARERDGMLSEQIADIMLILSGISADR